MSLRAAGIEAFGDDVALLELPEPPPLEAGQVLIEVEDRCGGLPAGDPDELFRPFEQRNANRTGLGLGLAISQQLVQASAHGSPQPWWRWCLPAKRSIMLGQAGTSTVSQCPLSTVRVFMTVSVVVTHRSFMTVFSSQ